MANCGHALLHDKSTCCFEVDNDQLIEFSFKLSHVTVRCVYMYRDHRPQDTVLAQMLLP